MASRSYVQARYSVASWLDVFLNGLGFGSLLTVRVDRLWFWRDRITVSGSAKDVAAFEDARLALDQEMGAW